MRYAIYGSVMIITTKPNLQTINEIIRKYPKVKSVYQRKTTIGENRRPILVHLAGEKNTLVSFKENNTQYTLDLGKITFSQGNSGLRRRLKLDISDFNNILDMFAAVGNLSLHIAKHKEVTVISTEKDPFTYKYLWKNVINNNLRNYFAYNMDCRDIKIQSWADHIFLGYHNITKTHLSVAHNAGKIGSKLHLHPLLYSKNYKSSINDFVDRILSWDKKFSNLTVNSINKIKKYSPNMIHTEVILEKTNI